VVVARTHALRGERGARFPERVFERVDDERRGNRFGQSGPPGSKSPDSTSKLAPSRG